MKQRLHFLFILSLISINAFAQNPFEQYNYKPKVATLSQGEYNEFHDQDTLVQIGSVILNTKTQEIVAFVKKDTLYSEATLEPDIVSRWLSPDPLAEKYTSWSPYNYVMNNPIIFIDPDGREIIYGEHITTRQKSVHEKVMKTKNPLIERYLKIYDGNTRLNHVLGNHEHPAYTTTLIDDNNNVTTNYSNSHFEQSELGMAMSLFHEIHHSVVHAENDMRVGEFSEKEADMIGHASLVVDMNEVNNTVSFLSDYSKDQDLGYNENQIKAVAYFSIFMSNTISKKKNDGKPIEITEEVRSSFTSFVKEVGGTQNFFRMVWNLSKDKNDDKE